MRIRRTAGLLLAAALAVGAAATGASATGDNGLACRRRHRCRRRRWWGRPSTRPSTVRCSSACSTTPPGGRPTDLGGHVRDSVGASLTAPGTILVGAQGTDSALWIRQGRLVAGHWTWGGWQSLGGRLWSGVSLGTDASGRVTVAVVGVGGSVWVRTRSAAGAWSGWTNRGGHTIDTPAVTAAGDLYATGIDRAVWAWTTTGGRARWVSLGGRTDYGPGAARLPATRSGGVVVTGTDHLVYFKSCQSDACGPWESLGGQAYGAPGVGVAETTSTGLDIVVQGRVDQAVYVKTWTDTGGWAGWRRAWTPTG